MSPKETGTKESPGWKCYPGNTNKTNKVGEISVQFKTTGRLLERTATNQQRSLSYHLFRDRPTATPLIPLHPNHGALLLTASQSPAWTRLKANPWRFTEEMLRGSPIYALPWGGERTHRSAVRPHHPSSPADRHSACWTGCMCHSGSGIHCTSSLKCNSTTEENDGQETGRHSHASCG